jgi:hypothetical protein
MTIAIANAKMTIRMLEENGYKSTPFALAELVDNSLEAKASNVRIIAINKKQQVNASMMNNIYELAVLDDGEGMNHKTLSNSVSLGWGTRLDSYLDKDAGLGKFGFGLKGSSISQCRIIDVYSWQNGIENCRRMTMNINDIFESNLEVLPEAVEDELPIVYRMLFKDIIKENGTLVRWRDLQKTSPKKTKTLAEHINTDFCRIYRHFLDDDDDLGEKRNIKIVTIDGNNGNYKIINEETLLANDPLYRLTPNNNPGDKDGNASNVPAFKNLQIYSEWSHDKIVIEGVHGKATIEITCSVAKPEIQALGGGSEIGQHAMKNQGISFVRSGREIEFGSFGYVNSYDTRERWWGVEVRFPPALDEIFGVTSNKQNVRSIAKLKDNSKKEDYAEAIAFNLQDAEYFKAVALTEIDRVLEENISKMRSIIVGRASASGASRKTGALTNAATIPAKVNTVIEKDTTRTFSEIQNADKSEEEMKQDLIEYFKRSDTELDDDDAKDLADSAINYKVDLHFDTWPGSLFLDVTFPANGVIGVINREHAFFNDFWLKLSDAEDKIGIQALQLVIMSYIRAEDELIRKYDKKHYNELRDSWGRWIKDLMPLVS